MFGMRTAGSSRSIWRIASATLFVALGLFTVSSISSTAARADDKPFWEKDDAPKMELGAKKYKKTAYKKSSKKYASKKSYKTVASYEPGEPKKKSKKLGGYAETTEPKKHKGVKVAALNNDEDYTPSKKSLSGGSVSWGAPSGCLDSGLKAILYDIAANFGPVHVNSTCRSKSHNAAVGGAPKSMHLTGDAVDFNVSGSSSAVYAYLKSNGGVGGLKFYGNHIHIDNGERRTW